jgi:hypothetical protein
MKEYMTFTLHMLDIGTFASNIITVPAWALWIVNLVVLTWLCEWLNERLLLSLWSQIWMIPPLIALIMLPENRNAWQTYGVVLAMLAQPYIHATLLGLVSRNCGSGRTRVMSVALYNMAVQSSHIIGINVSNTQTRTWLSLTYFQLYQRKDAPFYYHANKILLVVVIYSLFAITGAMLFYTWSNQQRTITWTGMSKHEKEKYLANTKDRGNRRLDFKFAF